MKVLSALVQVGEIMPFELNEQVLDVLRKVTVGRTSLFRDERSLVSLTSLPFLATNTML